MIVAFSLLASRGTPPPFWLFPIAFITIWFLVAFITSRTSGWNTLAQQYRTDQPFFGTRFNMQSAQMRRAINYNNCLTFGAAGEGLYMVPGFLMRAFHSPMLVPWHEITATSIKLWRFWDFAELRCQRVPEVPIRIRAKLAAQIAEASAGQFRYGSSVERKF